MICYRYKVELDTNRIIEEEFDYELEKFKSLGVEGKSCFARYNEWPNRYFYAEGISRKMCVDMIREKAEKLQRDGAKALNLLGPK